MIRAPDGKKARELGAVFAPALDCSGLRLPRIGGALLRLASCNRVEAKLRLGQGQFQRRWWNQPLCFSSVDDGNVGSLCPSNWGFLKRQSLSFMELGDGGGGLVYMADWLIQSRLTGSSESIGDARCRWTAPNPAADVTWIVLDRLRCLNSRCAARSSAIGAPSLQATIVPFFHSYRSDCVDQIQRSLILSATFSWSH